jgi:hypothetical protein
MHMWMATMDKGLAVTLYGPCQVHTTAGGNVKVEVEVGTSYPFEESIVLTVRPEKDVTFPLYLRIPGWCRTPEIRVNGKRVSPISEGKAFVRVIRRWRQEDKVVLRFPMSVRIVRGRETPYPQIEYFRNNRGLAQQREINSPYGCVYYGPLLFSLPIQDEGPNQEMPGVKYNYALDVSPERARTDEAAVIRRPMPERWTWSLSSPVQLAVRAREFDWQPTELEPLPKDVVRGGKPARVVLVPYGCTKFRISMFPMTAESWGSR